MKTLEIEVPDDVADRLQQIARKTGIAPADVVRASIDEKLARDREFEEAASHVLTKNRQLYERLS